MQDKENGLTEKESIFIAEYLINGFNGSQAALKAGYSEQSCRQIATENLSKPHIREHIKEYLDNIIGQYKNTLEYEILKSYRIMAFYDPADIITPNGLLKKNDLKDYGELSIVIKGIEKRINAQGKEMIKITLQDRDEALEKLCQYMGLLKQQIEHSGTIKVDDLTDEEIEKRIKELNEKKS
jgi:phage terminase small subunit